MQCKPQATALAKVVRAQCASAVTQSATCGEHIIDMNTMFWKKGASHKFEKLRLDFILMKWIIYYISEQNN